mgnify:CR=1 FL=1
MYKKVYIEITNDCNLSCSFCIKNTRIKKYMSFDNFKLILDKLNNYTNYLYFHVLGEPLLHPNINEFINYASLNYKVNITTNGYLINNIVNQKNIRQLNISLQSYNEIYGISLDEYMNNIFNIVDKIKKYTYVSYRIWIKNKYTNDIIKLINKKYKSNIDIDSINNNFTLDKNVFISTHEEFIWPDSNNDYYNSKGTCYALKDHIGILVDGTIIPCCLDSKGKIRLGNIFDEDLKDIINSDRYKRMLNGFKENKKIEELCKTCKYLMK